MLTAIRCHDLHFNYPGREPLFGGIDLHLSVGWTGVVGPNGAGKTTLLRLLAGALSPTHGRVEKIGAREPLIVECAQRVDEPDAQIHSLAEGLDGDAWRWMGLLGVAPDLLDRWDSLSMGERKRWQVAAALWRRPDLLLLDEPTNHLDSQARELLRDALAQFNGIGLAVSHDRELLEALTAATLRVDPAEQAGAALYRGSYDLARQTWEADAAAKLAARESLKSEKARLARRLADTRRDRATAESQISTRARSKGPRDTDARTLAAKGRVQNAEAKLSRRVTVLQRQVAKKTTALDGVTMRKSLGRDLFVEYQPAPKDILAAIDLAELKAGTSRLASDVNLAVRRETKWALWGPNGIGKTTLIDALLDGLTIPPERVLYLPQHLPRGRAERLLCETRELPNDQLAQVMNIVAALGVPPGQLLESASPSPGEARKLMLAHGLGRQAWLLVLDEPTNHLDLPSIERLETLLSAYPGALLLVSHDRRFAQAVCAEVVRFEQGRVSLGRWADD